MIKRRDFIKMLGGALGAVALTPRAGTTDIQMSHP